MNHSRQSGLIDESIFDTPITVIGAGGIGSFTVLALAKCGFKHIAVYDDDKVEEHNLASQYYRDMDIGMDKVEALYEIVKSFTNISIGAVPSRWTRSNILDGIVILAVDNMETRKEIYEHMINNTSVIAVVDGRMGGNQLEVYTYKRDDREDRKRYKSVLWDDSQTSPLPCTERAVMYNVLNIASWITNQVRLVLSNKEYMRALILDLETMTLVTPTPTRE
jgi:molybdopterin/thiamine biosynthesis adenylyltransferase